MEAGENKIEGREKKRSEEREREPHVSKQAETDGQENE